MTKKRLRCLFVFHVSFIIYSYLGSSTVVGGSFSLWLISQTAPAVPVRQPGPAVSQLFKDNPFLTLLFLFSLFHAHTWSRFINARRRIVQPMIDQSNRAGKSVRPRENEKLKRERLNSKQNKAHPPKEQADLLFAHTSFLRSPPFCSSMHIGL